MSERIDIVRVYVYRSNDTYELNRRIDLDRDYFRTIIFNETYIDVFRVRVPRIPHYWSN